MRKLLRIIRIKTKITSINNNDNDKVEFLKELGIRISIIDKNDRYKKGYTLGRMKDECPRFRVANISGK